MNQPTYMIWNQTSFGLPPPLPPQLPLKHRKHFHATPHIWYVDLMKCSAHEFEELYELCVAVFDDLESKDPVRREERGIVPEEFGTSERELATAARKVQHTACFRIAELLRYHNPVRLGEGVRFLRWLERDFTSFRPGRTLHDDPVIAVWLAFALEAQGSDADLKEALSLLSPSVINTVRASTHGQNELLARGCKTRILRRLGRVRDAQEEEKQLGRDIVEHLLRPGPRCCPPYVRHNLGEATLANVICSLGRDPLADWPEQSYTMPPVMAWGPPSELHYHLMPRPLEADKRGRKECWTTGCRVSEHLQKCKGCHVATYCSREHQKVAWKRHRAHCERYGKESAE